MPLKQPRVQLLDAALVLEDIAARAGVLRAVLLGNPIEGIAGLDRVDLFDEDGVLAVVQGLHAPASRIAAPAMQHPVRTFFASIMRLPPFSRSGRDSEDPPNPSRPLQPSSVPVHAGAPSCHSA